MSKIREVKMKIIKPMLVEWICPRCDKKNIKEFYNAPERTRLMCLGCGKLFVGSRQKEE